MDKSHHYIKKLALKYRLKANVFYIKKIKAHRQQKNHPNAGGFCISSRLFFIFVIKFIVIMDVAGFAHGISLILNGFDKMDWIVAQPILWDFV